MRREFPSKIKIAAFQRANGRCQKCTGLLMPGKFRYDHIKPDWMGGEPTLENCQAICVACDKPKTAADQRSIAKVKRLQAKRAGVKRPRTITRWRKMSGQPVFAPRER